MSHTYSCPHGYTFIYNGDGSGNTLITRLGWDGLPPCRSVHIPTACLKEFVAELIRSERISTLEQMSAEDLLK